jgi:prolyl 4-hydroxylase
MPPQDSPLLLHAFQLSQAGRKAEAIVLLNQLAAEGDPGALFTLADLKWRGGMVPQDVRQGRDFYRRAGEAGHRLAAAYYTNLLASGIAGPRDWPKALKRLREEARQDTERKRIQQLIHGMQLTGEGDPVPVPEAQRLSEDPEVLLYPKAFSTAEVDYLRQLAEPGYQPSVVQEADGRLVRDPVRTSEGSTIHWLIENPAVHALNRRLAALSGTLAEQGEPLQILRYRPGQQYHSHLDFIPGADNQRALTALIYLNNDYEGGETAFVRTSLKVRGRKGDALIFRNIREDRSANPLSEHAGLPVVKGAKFLASRWIRERRWAA